MSSFAFLQCAENTRSHSPSHWLTVVGLPIEGGGSCLRLLLTTLLAEMLLDALPCFIGLLLDFEKTLLLLLVLLSCSPITAKRFCSARRRRDTNDAGDEESEEIRGCFVESTWGESEEVEKRGRGGGASPL